MKKTAFESDRITVKENPEELEIIISGKIPQNQFIVLSVWLVLWTIAGLYVLSQLFAAQPNEIRIFIFVWLIFWVYFEYKVVTAWLWRKYGREIFRIQKDNAELRFELLNGGKSNEFRSSEIEKISNLEPQKGLFIKNYFSSYWVVGGESISIEYQGKLYLFGRQISQQDADLLIRRIKNRLKI
jgi:hypothetical protein